MSTKTLKLCTIGAAIMTLAALTGCRSGVPLQVAGAYQPMPRNGLDLGKFSQTPKPRMGCLPWPGLFSLFALGDPQRLGHHAYSTQKGAPEADRGIFYTCRGGFIDIAHARKFIDASKLAGRAEAALLNDWDAFQFKGLEPTVYVVRLHYPPYWKSLSRAEKQTLAHELSIRIGPRIAMLMLTWHELLTWFGYQSTPLISEKPSAFTWDDTGAHAFGIMAADRALRDSRDWDDAVTDAINAGFAELGVVSSQECSLAINKIEGSWWNVGGPLKRDIDWGWHGEPIVPWLVSNLPFCRNATPHVYYLPQMRDVMGRDFSGLVKIEIHPNVWQSGQISAVVPGEPDVLDADTDVPVILEYIRRSFVKKEGPMSVRPE